MPERRVDVADAFAWLPDQEGAVVAVLPDAAELDLPIGVYRSWLYTAAQACVKASAGPSVLSVTDRLHGGQWVSKAGIIMEAAGMEPLLWHKIALRSEVGRTDLHRPTYTHVLAFGLGRPGPRTPDVFYAGAALWRDGAGVLTATMITRYLAHQQVPAVVNPFCGVGTLLAAANAAGLDACGCDLDADRAEQARTLELPWTP